MTDEKGKRPLVERINEFIFDGGGPPDRGFEEAAHSLLREAAAALGAATKQTADGRCTETITIRCALSAGHKCDHLSGGGHLGWETT